VDPSADFQRDFTVLLAAEDPVFEPSNAGRPLHSRAPIADLAGPTIELQPSPQFIKRNVPLLGHLICEPVQFYFLVVRLLAPT
jgi:hypothetical protein